MPIEHELDQHEHGVDAERWQEIIEHPLQRGRTFEQYTNELSNFARAFEADTSCIVCIDEGTPHGLHAAGSGILMENESAAVAMLRRSGAQGARSHKGCGAAGIYAKRIGISPEKSDVAGARRLRELCDKAGIPYFGHIEKIERPSYHNAWVCYYDGTGSFDRTLVEGLPSGFVVSRTLHESSEVPAGEVELSVEIAFGSHGWGRKRFEESGAQFIIVPIGGKIPLQQLEAELREIQLKYGTLVRIDPIKAKQLAVVA